MVPPSVIVEGYIYIYISYVVSVCMEKVFCNEMDKYDYVN